MNTVLIVSVCVLITAVIILAIKLILVLHRINEIQKQLPEIIGGGTNKLLTVSGGDAAIKNLAVELNVRLAEVREKELRYDSGDKEVKSALTNAAHDLRTPLTAVSGYLDLLENESDEDKREKYLSVIRERTATLSRLSEELFAYSVAADGFREGRREQLDAGSVLKECLADFYEGFTAKNITPEIQVPSPSFNLIADKTDLMRMFSNLISNVLKYSAGDFKVGIDGRKITFGNTAENIDFIDVNKLFDRFYTVKNGKTATGLGLSIAKIICERLGGEISASLDGNYLEIALRF